MDELRKVKALLAAARAMEGFSFSAVDEQEGYTAALLAFTERKRALREALYALEDCGCTWETGTWFPCVTHMTPHTAHVVPAPGCPGCEEVELQRRAIASGGSLTPGDIATIGLGHDA